MGEGGGFAEEGVEGDGLEVGGVEVGVEGGERRDLAREKGEVMAADAAEAPLGVDQFADVPFLGEVVGLEVIAEVVDESVVFGGVIAGRRGRTGSGVRGAVVPGERALPSAERGPVDWVALARLGAVWASEAMG